MLKVLLCSLIVSLRLAFLNHIDQMLIRDDFWSLVLGILCGLQLLICHIKLRGLGSELFLGNEQVLHLVDVTLSELHLLDCASVGAQLRVWLGREYFPEGVQS